MQPGIFGPQRLMGSAAVTSINRNQRMIEMEGGRIVAERTAVF
jgi:hypothetical protein